jgi:dTDP-4-dehydrorhamnose reductase
MLGHKLCQILSRDLEVWATFRDSPRPLPALYRDTRPLFGVDAVAFDSVADALGRVRPDVVVNAVGIVKQRAEAHDPIPSITVNALFPHRVAALCAASSARFIHFSTDCVFSGRRGRYREEDEPDPVDLYGRSKLLGEVAGAGALTLRTSIVGRELEQRSGLLEWFLHAGERVPGYTRVIWSGLTTNRLAAIVRELIRTRTPVEGLYHVSMAPLSKHDVLVGFREAFGRRTEIVPDPGPVLDRSLDSTRFWSRTGFNQPSWNDMLAELAEDAAMYETELHARR